MAKSYKYWTYTLRVYHSDGLTKDDTLMDAMTVKKAAVKASSGEIKGCIVRRKPSG